MPVRRPRHGKALLTIGAGAVTVSMTGCPFVAANLVAIPPPPAPVCHASDDPNQWFIGTATGQNPITVTLSLQTFAVSGVNFANFFAVDGGTLSGKTFDAGSAAAATSVTLTIAVDPGVETVTIRMGATCDGAAKAIVATVDVISLGVAFQAQ